MTDLIKTLLFDWKERKIPEIKEREDSLNNYLTDTLPKIVAITGFRRVGKTFLMLGLIKTLLINNSKETIIYLNFEDERIPQKTEILTNLIPTLRATCKEETKMLFLDEIQNIPEWSKWLRRIYDQENMRIFISGSSSKMSSHEIPTELRGRFLELVVFPLSFREFLQFKNKNFDLKNIEYSTNMKAQLDRLLDEYLEFGGLPEIVLSSDERKTEIAQSYYQTVVRKDIIERYKIKNEEALKNLLKLLLNSKKYTISKLYNTIKSMNLEIGKSTLQQYIQHIENSYFMFSIAIFSYSIKNQMQYPRKNYFIDMVFINKIFPSFSKNTGRLYENTVAVELKRRKKEFYYWQNSEQEEVDFIIKKGTRIEQLIQVCSDISDSTVKKRETRSLINASKALKCNNLLIITEKTEKTEKISWFKTTRKINYLPLYKWLLRK